MKPTDADHLIRNTKVVQQVDPLFDAETASPLSRDALLRLAAGTLGTVRVPDMLTPELCERITAQLDGTEFST
ncbi:hypothetical protein ACFWN1_01820 [Streptomyces sp. NPDC058459]|uniref:hypothetical protein n=1 Tax=Streptomyces sp. NPDC058459 TaxID=3346508 RepID=UPI003650F05F